MVSRAALLHRIPERVVAGRDALLERGWLSGMPRDFQEALLSIAIWRTATPGETITLAGDEDGGLVGIAAGTVEVSALSGHPDARFVHLAHAGFWAGYRPLIGKPRNLSLTARTHVLWILAPRRAMEQMLAEQPCHWRHILELSDFAYETALQVMVDLTRHNGLVRVAATLLRLAGCRDRDAGPGSDIEIRVPQADIAALAVMSRNTPGAYLGELGERGLVEAGYRTIRILDPARLRAVVEAEE